MPASPFVNAWNARFLWTWLPPIGWFLLISGFSQASEPGSTQMSHGLVAWLLGKWAQYPEILRPAQIMARKLAHVAEFAVLAVLFWRALGGRGWLRPVLICGLCAALDEFHQALVPGRGASWKDWFVDMLGPLCCRLSLPRAPRRLVKTLLWGTLHEFGQRQR